MLSLNAMGIDLTAFAVLSGALAVGLGADRLLFLTDVPGVLVDGETTLNVIMDAEFTTDRAASAAAISACVSEQPSPSG